MEKHLEVSCEVHADLTSVGMVVWVCYSRRSQKLCDASALGVHLDEDRFR